MNEFSLLKDRTPNEERNAENENSPRSYVETVSTRSADSANQSQIFADAKSQSANLIHFTEEAFEHDLAVADRRQKFAGEILRSALIGIVAIGFLLLNFLFGASDKAPEAFAVAKKTLANSDFRFYIFASFYLFAFSAGFALLQRYFAADANASHLKYVRLREKSIVPTTENVSHLIPHSRRGFLDGFWMYLFGAETDEIHQQTENEKDARDFLFKISRVLLFLSGLLLWLGAVSLILAFGVVFKQFGA